MLKSIKSNNKSFKPVIFRQGFNVIQVERPSQESKEAHKPNTNKARKATLLDIIHFCLGSRSDNKGSILKSKELSGWSFFLEFTIGGHEFEVERRVDWPNHIFLHKLPPIFNLDTKFDPVKDSQYVSIDTYNDMLRKLFFGLSDENENKMPSFRELISYFVRRNPDGYGNAFDYSKAQKSLSRQGCNAYFLDLNMGFASEFHHLKEESKKIKTFQNALKSGLVKDFSFNIWKLESEVFKRHVAVLELKKQLDSFCVHPHYFEILSQANELTEKIHICGDTLVLRQQLLERYEESVKEETIGTSIEQLRQIYEEAGIFFHESLVVQLHEVINFHKILIANRRDYLKSEIYNLKNEINDIKRQIEILTATRAKSLLILNTHGALEEYTKLQENYALLVQRYEEAKCQKEKVYEITKRKAENTIKTKQLVLSANQDYNARASIRERAIRLFDENTRFLYHGPGILTIEVKDHGYDFNLEIKSAKSQGIPCMKVFCYDLLLAELGKLRRHSPEFLIHDSVIFDGVDKRQIALALMLAKKKSEEIGFQYICMINPDTVPISDFNEPFKRIFEDSVILTL